MDSCCCRAINTLRFQKASKMLFPIHNAPWANNLAINLRDVKLCDPSIVSYSKYRPHVANPDEVDRSIKKIVCYPNSNFLLSGAALERTSVAIYDLTREDFASISIPKGVFTFDFSEDLNMLATGGADCSLRLWNPYVPSNPLAALPGHSSPITHLAFNVNYNQVITISHNEIIKIWDIVEHVCMNTLAAVIPHRTLQNKFPISCMLWHEKTQCLVTACKDELCVTQMSRHEETTASLTSHRAPLSCIKILPEFGHVITACTRGDLKVWDFTTGELLMELSATHGAAAITAMASTDNNTRIITGGSDGSVIIWNTFSGVPTQRLVTTHGKEVTDIATSKDAVYITGWGGKVSCYRRTRADVRKDHLNPDPLWHPTGGHHGDISTMDFLQPAMLATGAEDGTIKIWNTNLMKTVADFNPREAVRQRVPSANHSTGVQSLLATANKTPVDRVLWLRTRVKAGRRAKTASLVASGQGGLCQFWSPFKGTLMGWFTASHSRLANEKVRALVASSDEQVLATGDTQGYVHLWDISNYCTESPDALKGDQVPPVLAKWRAHVQPITDMLLLLEGGHIVTASTDCSVRVWTDKGDYIGTFGAAAEGSWMISNATSLTLEEAHERAKERRQSGVATSPVLARSGRTSPAMTTLGSLAEDDSETRSTSRKSVESVMTAGTAAQEHMDVPEVERDGVEEEAEPVEVDLPENVLGKQIRSQLQLRTLKKQQVRKSKSDIDFSRTGQPGFQFCAPYRVLQPAELASTAGSWAKHSPDPQRK